MLPSWSRQIERRPQGHWWWGLVMLGVLLCAGCADFNPRGSSYRDDELSDTAKQIRSSEHSGQPFGFTNKARQIEEDFGYYSQ